MDILQTLRSERSKLQDELNSLDAAIKALGGTSLGGRQSTSARRPTMSAAARARIAAAQRARWAKVRANAGQKLSVATRKRPKLSAAGKARIAAAQRARWAKIKAKKTKKSA
jgi:hypothetical protein